MAAVFWSAWLARWQSLYSVWLITHYSRVSATGRGNMIASLASSMATYTMGRGCVSWHGERHVRLILPCSLVCRWLLYLEIQVKSHSASLVCSSQEWVVNRLSQWKRSPISQLLWHLPTELLGVLCLWLFTLRCVQRGDHMCVCVCSRVGKTLHRKYTYFSFSLQMYTMIWLDGVQCTGTESSLAECRHWGWGVSDCNHNDDVSIACYDNTTTVAPPGECEYMLQSVIVYSCHACINSLTSLTTVYGRDFKPVCKIRGLWLGQTSEGWDPLNNTLH